MDLFSTAYDTAFPEIEAKIKIKKSFESMVSKRNKNIYTGLEIWQV